MTDKKFNVWEFFKANFGSILLTLYVIGSFVFIIMSIYSSVLVTYVNNAYIQGQQQTILTIAQKIQGAQCQPLTLQLGQQGSLSLLDANCVTKGQPTSVPTTGGK